MHKFIHLLFIIYLADRVKQMGGQKSTGEVRMLVQKCQWAFIQALRTAEAHLRGEPLGVAIP